MLVRLAKILLVAQIGVFAARVGYNNIVDYNSNFQFVRHVLSMDTTFPGNALMGRAITSEAIHNLAYQAIIAAELLTAVLCLAGAIRLLTAVGGSPDAFQRAKALAVAGLVCGFTTWFFGFMTVGAQWFQMWQSQTWNGQQSAFRFIACIGLVLVVLMLPEPAGPQWDRDGTPVA